MKAKFSPLLIKLIALANLMLTPVVSMATPVDILGGTNYFYTSASYFPGFGNLVGVPNGPNGTDTSIMRQGICSLDLGNSGSACNVNVRLTELDLQGKTNPDLFFRESLLSPTHSTGVMTMFSNGSGTGGTFDVNWNVYIDISLDHGLSWAESPVQGFSAVSVGTPWTINPFGTLIYGSVGDLYANTHVNLDPISQADFFPNGIIKETNPVGAYDIFASTAPAVPEPSSIWMMISGLLMLLAVRNAHKPIAYFEKIIPSIKKSLKVFHYSLPEYLNYSHRNYNLSAA